MRVKELMEPEPHAVFPGTNLGEVVRLMWESDCGVIPIVDDAYRVQGVITDRDICIALGTIDRRPSELFVSDLEQRQLFVAHPDEDLRGAMGTMAEHHVRRLPVAESDGRLVGMLSITDIVTATTLDQLAPLAERREFLALLQQIVRHASTPRRPKIVA